MAREGFLRLQSGRHHKRRMACMVLQADYITGVLLVNNFLAFYADWLKCQFGLIAIDAGSTPVR